MLKTDLSRSRNTLVQSGNLVRSHITIRVSMDALGAKADAVLTAAQGLKYEFEEIGRVIDRTVAYWNGEAAEGHRRMCRELISESETMIECLIAHSKNLREISGLYTQTETVITQATTALPKDAIV